jgi:hypothetical protein
MLTVYAIVCGFLLILGITLIIQAVPYFTNSKTNNISPIKKIYCAQLNAWIKIKMTTNAIVAANNPIDIQVNTTSLDLDQIKTIQLTFEGAEKEVTLTGTPPVDPTPPPNDASKEDKAQYEADLKKYTELYSQYHEQELLALRANVLDLESDRDYDELVQREHEVNAGRQYLLNTTENITLPKSSTFSGLIQGVNYPAGGKFDVGITIIMRDGTAFGYGINDSTYVLKDAIEVSPPEVTLQIENNSIMLGLAWAGAGLVIAAIGISGLLEILKHFAFS